MILKTIIKGVPVEAHNLIKIVKRYYGPLCRIYHTIIIKLPDINKDMALQMAFKTINDFTGPNGLIPTLLIFGAYPCIVEFDAFYPIVIKRAAALKTAIEKIKKLKAER